MGTSASGGRPGKPTSCKADMTPRSDPDTYVSTQSGLVIAASVADACSRADSGLAHAPRSPTSNAWR